MRKADNLPPFPAVVTKSGNLNLLEPSGHLEPVMGLIFMSIKMELRKLLIVTVVTPPTGQKPFACDH